MNSEVPTEIKTRVLQKVRDAFRHGQRMNWDELARRIAPLFRDGLSDAPDGLRLSKWVNDGLQKKRFDDWFVREHRSWRASLGKGQMEEAIEPVVESDTEQDSVIVVVDREETILGWPLAVVGEERRIEDEEIAQRLGRPVATIRKLIERIWPEIHNRPPRTIVESGANGGGGKPRKPYLLNERETLKVCLRCEGDVAEKIQDEVIEVYVAVKGAAAPAKLDASMEAFRLLGWKTQEHDAKIAEANRAAEEAQASVLRVEGKVDQAKSVAEQAVEKVTAVEAQVGELAKRGIGSGAPPKKSGWKFLAEFASIMGLPVQGPASKISHELTMMLKGPARSLAANADAGNGLSALTIAPHLQNEMAPLARIIVTKFGEWGWEVLLGRFLPKHGIKPARSIEWVRRTQAMPAVISHLHGQPAPQQVIPFNKNV